MSPGLDRASRMQAARNLLIDHLTAEIVATFAARGIESLVLKGPALAAWLYPDEVRPYVDSDIMVAPGDWRRAVAVLQGLGFHDYLQAMAHPRLESLASTSFVRDSDYAGREHLDLHRALDGCEGDRQRTWDALAGGADAQIIAGAELRVPGRGALLLHVALHAARDPDDKPIEDLRRALRRAEEPLWQEALRLARDLDGLAAFASGLRLLPPGRELARRLGVEDVRSPPLELRYQGVPMAEGIDALLSPGMGMRQRLAMLVAELFPRPEFLRWWSPLARRGRLGLALAYVWRPLWLTARAPRALIAWWRVRGGSDR